MHNDSPKSVGFRRLKQKNRSPSGCGFLLIDVIAGGSALGELEALAGTGLTGLFAFLHARVAGEETERLDNLAVFGIDLGEAARNRVTDRNGLCVDATTFDDHIDVIFVGQRGRLKGGENRVLEFDRGKVVFEGARVDDDLAAAFGEPDSRDCGFATAGGAW